MSNVTVTAAELFSFVLPNKDALSCHEKDGIILRLQLNSLLPEELLSFTINHLQNQLGVLLEEGEHPIAFVRDRNIIEYNIISSGNKLSYFKVFFLSEEKEVIVVMVQLDDTMFIEKHDRSPHVAKLVDILQYAFSHCFRNFVKIFALTDDLIIYDDDEKYQYKYQYKCSELCTELDSSLPESHIEPTKMKFEKCLLSSMTDSDDSEIPEWYTEPNAEMKFEDFFVPSMSDWLENLTSNTELAFDANLNIELNAPVVHAGVAAGLTRQTCEQVFYPEDAIDRFYCGGDRPTEDELKNILEQVDVGVYSEAKVATYFKTVQGLKPLNEVLNEREYERDPPQNSFWNNLLQPNISPICVPYETEVDEEPPRKRRRTA